MHGRTIPLGAEVWPKVKRPGRTSMGLAEHQVAWQSIPQGGRSILAEVQGYLGMNRLLSCVQVRSGRGIRPEKARPRLGVPWLGVNDAVMSPQSREDAYLCPCPALLTMTTGQHGYRVYQLGMEVHIASNQGATRGHGLSLVGPQHGRGLSLPSHVVSYRCKGGGI